MHSHTTCYTRTKNKGQENIAKFFGYFIALLRKVPCTIDATKAFGFSNYVFPSNLRLAIICYVDYTVIVNYKGISLFLFDFVLYLQVLIDLIGVTVLYFNTGTRIISIFTHGAVAIEIKFQSLANEYTTQLFDYRFTNCSVKYDIF